MCYLDRVSDRSDYWTYFGLPISAALIAFAVLIAVAEAQYPTPVIEVTSPERCECGRR